MIKILLGGSPCTFWSIAQRNSRETTASGQGWELFKNYLIAKEKFKPDLFLYENNKSAAAAIKAQIAERLHTDLMYINSSLVSAQNRERFYAFNWQCTQPKDRGIMLKDILQSGIVDREKSYVLKHQAGNARDYLKKHHTQIAFEPIAISDTKGKARAIRAAYGKGGYENFISHIDPQTGVALPVRIGDIGTNAQANRVYSSYGKSRTLIANAGGGGGLTGLYMIAANRKELFTNNMVYYLKSESGTMIFENKEHKIITVYIVRNGQISYKEKQYPINLPDGYYIIRKLTPIECERLQTLPDNYTAGISNTQRYKCLGNGWTAEVIIHILNAALKDVSKNEKLLVLSMYDGIGTGRYCLDKMGFTNVEYHAYEIDKYALAVSSKNYPDIIYHGDAFKVRDADVII